MTEEPRKEVNVRLSRSDARTLAAVLDLGSCTSKELEEHLGVRKSAIHKSITNLRADGLIRGERGAEVVGHRPPFRFSITSDGIDVLEAYERSRVEEGQTRLAQLAEARMDRGLHGRG